jgi:hypothetical protein
MNTDWFMLTISASLGFSRFTMIFWNNLEKLCTMLIGR